MTTMIEWLYVHINFVLSFSLLGLMWIRPHRAVFIFALLTNLFNYLYLYLETSGIMTDASALPYYAGAALTDYLIIRILSKFVHPDSLIIDLQTALRCFIYINLFGWLLWVTYNAPDRYNNLSTLMYLYAIYVILTKGRRDNVGDLDMGIRGINFRVNRDKSDYSVQRHEEKV